MTFYRPFSGKEALTAGLVAEVALPSFLSITSSDFRDTQATIDVGFAKRAPWIIGILISHFGRLFRPSQAIRMTGRSGDNG